MRARTAQSPRPECGRERSSSEHHTARRADRARRRLTRLLPMPPDVALHWLRTSRAGHCGATDSNNRGDCATGNFGNLGLNANEASNWTVAVSACLARCAACSQCKHISVSLQHRDCSWYAQCGATHTDVFCFRSGSVVEPDAIAAVSPPPPPPPIFAWSQPPIDPMSIAIVQASDRPPPLPLDAVIESDGAGSLRPVAGLGGKGIRSLTSALNRAYASLHGYTYIYARIVGGCGRALSAWCQLPAVLGLLRERASGGTSGGTSGGGGSTRATHKYSWLLAMDEDVAFNTRAEFAQWLALAQSPLPRFGDSRGRGTAQCTNRCVPPESMLGDGIGGGGGASGGGASGGSASGGGANGGGESPLQRILESTCAADGRVATELPCLMVGKEIDGWPGINVGSRFLRNSPRTHRLLAEWWAWPMRQQPASRQAEYLHHFPGELRQGPSLLHMDTTSNRLALPCLALPCRALPCAGEQNALFH